MWKPGHPATGWESLKPAPPLTSQLQEPINSVLAQTILSWVSATFIWELPVCSFSWTIVNTWKCRIAVSRGNKNEVTLKCNTIGVLPYPCLQNILKTFAGFLAILDFSHIEQGCAIFTIPGIPWNWSSLDCLGIDMLLIHLFSYSSGGCNSAKQRINK